MIHLIDETISSSVFFLFNNVQKSQTVRIGICPFPILHNKVLQMNDTLPSPIKMNEKLN